MNSPIDSHDADVDFFGHSFISSRYLSRRIKLLPCSHRSRGNCARTLQEDLEVELNRANGIATYKVSTTVEKIVASDLR